MKLTIITALLFIFFVFFHQTTPAQSPDKILNKAIKAMGGEKVLRKVTSSKCDGSITRLSDNASGKFQLQTVQPNLYASSFDLNGFETSVGYNGKSGWTRDSKNGLRTLTGAEGRDFQVESNYRNNRWLDYKKEKSKVVYAGKINVNGKPADLVLLTTVKGTTVKMYFDAVSGLLVRDEIPAGDTKYTFDYSDIRTIDGIQEPFSIVSTAGDEKYEIKLDSVVHNAAIAKSVFDFPVISNEPLPDIAGLLKELQTNQERIDNILENYSFTQAVTLRELGKDGVLREKESRTFQVSFYKGKRISRLTAKNGQPLSADEQAKEDKKIEKIVNELENKEAKKLAKLSKQSGEEKPDEDDKRISVAELLRASNLVNPRRERFRGRDVIVFDFEPNPNFDFRNVKSFLKFFGKMAGVMWIDAQDKQVTRLEAVLADNFKMGGVLANLQKGAAYISESERVNDEVWLPSRVQLNASIKVLLVKGINVNQVVEYSDFHKFKTEVKDLKIGEIK
ncbi:MAG TPA: hypothetical protein VF596_09580 [Pyrinomonadaceae bacterium]|jgi:hypothetical protein